MAGCGQGGGAEAGKSPGGGDTSSREESRTPSAPPTSQPPSTPPATPPAPSSPPTNSLPPQGERLVSATATGGIDGRFRSVLVNGDGTYTTLDRKKAPKKGRMGKAELAELRDALADSGFARLPRVSMADPPVRDGITTAVIYQGREVATDGMKKIPELDRVIAALPGLN
ncbi:hypothetical protein [Streptomyces sp. NPDC051561]|uniref:hypothetical protein n=1 Tax=Streptomyces sp. NPDC051561 TaxID=3365658 RepID=UPI0037B79D01